MLGNLTVQRLCQDTPDTLLHITRGKLVTSFHTRSAGSLCRYKASGISVTPTGDVIVTDIGLDQSRMFTSTGKHVLTFNTLPEDHPTKAITLNSKQVAIACRTGLKIYQSDGEFLRKIREAPECPNGLARTHGGDLVVSDMTLSSCVLHIFTGLELRLIHTIIGGSRAPCFERPWYVAVNGDNEILVSDMTEHTVKVFNAYGGLLHEFGVKGCQPGQFFHPAGLCIDRYENILVADSYNDRVQYFTKTGELLGVILNGMEDELCNPVDVDIDGQGHLVVLQGDGKVLTFQYLWT